MEKEEIPIETFDALLRDLLAWDLVVPTGADSDSWRLVARAQERLEELVITKGPWPAERTVYFDRRCADCGKRQLTWMRDGQHMCDPCWQRRLASPQDEPATVGVVAARNSRWVRRHRQRVAS